MIRRPPRSTRVRSSAASDVYKRQRQREWTENAGDERSDSGAGRDAGHMDPRSEGEGAVDYRVAEAANTEITQGAQPPRRASPHCSSRSLVHRRGQGPITLLAEPVMSLGLSVGYPSSSMAVNGLDSSEFSSEGISRVPPS